MEGVKEKERKKQKEKGKTKTHFYCNECKSQQIREPNEFLGRRRKRMSVSLKTKMAKRNSAGKVSLSS